MYNWLDRYRIVFILMFFFSATTMAQRVTGVVTEADTGEPVPYLNVYYDKSGIGTTTDLNGRYSIQAKSGRKLTFSAVGYKTKVIAVSGKDQVLNVKIEADDVMISEVVVKPKREKYSRKNNPAVEMMKKVISAKKSNDLAKHPYYQYNKYQKLTLSLNDLTAENLESSMFKKMPFLKDQVEFCPETQKLILPVSVDETVSKKIYRKDPESEKTIIKGQNSSGINEIFNTGDILTTVLQDVFTDVNIYDDQIRLLQYPFTSPIASSGAISFYKYYIMDTIYVEKEKCFHLTFVPNNSQDFGFTGHLYVKADSSYQVKKCVLNLPKKSDVNFVEHLDILQEFEELPSGENVLVTDDMIAEIKFMKFFNKFQVRRSTRYNDYAFDELPKALFKRKGKEIREADAMMRDEDFWNEYRQVELTKSESGMDAFIRRLEQMKGFKYVVFGLKALIENFVETSAKDSKVDIGPINTLVGSNDFEGFRTRLSAQTTANFNKHLFLRGYGAYGFKDERFKYKAEVEYSFDPKKYLPREFPRHSIVVGAQYDMVSPVDKFMQTDKDNVFTAFKVTKVDQMMYQRNLYATYQREFETGFSYDVGIKSTKDEPVGSLAYERLSDGVLLDHISTTELSVGIRYAPGETFINTKQRRLPINLDAPVFTLSHTFGLKTLGGDYTYNYTEAGIYKRFWMRSWGKIDCYVKGGIQWNQVPFPMLIMPAANLSYIIQYETFNLINNMEFLNDRYASLDVSWDLNGKIFNRIPLLKRLKWREYIGVKVLWGTLTDKNNPFLAENAQSDMLFRFPSRDGVYTSHIMDKNEPYVELSAGVHNIFKILHVEYVRRLNYLDNPYVNKDGIRFMLRMTF